MIAAFAAGAVANAHYRRIAVAARRLGHEPDIAAAVANFVIEARQLAVGQRLVAFRPVVAGIASGDGSNKRGVAANRHFHLVIHLQADIALALAQRNVVARHPAHAEFGVRHGGQDSRHRQERERGPAEIEFDHVLSITP